MEVAAAYSFGVPRTWGGSGAAVRRA